MKELPFNKEDVQDLRDRKSDLVLLDVKDDTNLLVFFRYNEDFYNKLLVVRLGLIDLMNKQGDCLLDKEDLGYVIKKLPKGSIDDVIDILLKADEIIFEQLNKDEVKSNLFGTQYTNTSLIDFGRFGTRVAFNYSNTIDRSGMINARFDIDLNMPLRYCFPCNLYDRYKDFRNYRNYRPFNIKAMYCNVLNMCNNSDYKLKALSSLGAIHLGMMLGFVDSDTDEIILGT